MDLARRTVLSRIASFGFGLIIAFGPSGCASDSDAGLRQEIYVWQQQWTAAVSHAVSDTPPSITGWRVLLAEVDTSGVWHRVVPEPAALSSAARSKVSVFRFDGQRQITDPERTAIKVVDTLTGTGSVAWTGLEIDYDCPTRSLPSYKAFLSRLKPLLAERHLPLSITILPTWLGSDQLRNLLLQVDSSVLQVHSVLDPHRGLFDPKLASTWIRDFASVSPRPFAVALPDYGSAVLWNPAGRIAAIVSEGEDLGLPADAQELSADPQTIQAFLSRVRAAHPKLMTGIVWFRLPVEGDRRVWSRETLARVIDGGPLIRHLAVELEPDSEGATRITLHNVGSVDAPLPKTLRLALRCPAADAQGAYGIEHDEHETRWVRSAERWLRVGNRVTIGWLRCNGEGLRLEE